MLAVCVIALLSLVSISHSAPLVCEDLVRPLDQLHHLEARWVLVAGSLNNTAYVEQFNQGKTASITFVNETSQMSFMVSVGFGDSCHYLNDNITLEGSGFALHMFNRHVTFVHTSCPDCLVMYFNDKPKTDARLYLLSKRREVDQKEMEDFKAQVECLNMPAPILLDPNKELCPEQMSEDPAAQTKEEIEGQEA